MSRHRSTLATIKSQPGIRAQVDSLGRIHYCTDLASQHQERRFMRLLEGWLAGRLLELPADQQLLISAICTEAITSAADLVLFADAAVHAIRTSEGVIALWTTAEERLDARLLSPWTTIATERIRHPTNWCRSIEELEQWLDTFDAAQSSGLERCRSKPLEAVFLGARSFWLRLPGALYAHITRLQPMTAAPESWHARSQSGLAVARASDPARLEAVAEDAIAGSVVKVCVADRRHGPSPVLEQVLDTLKQPVSRTAASDRAARIRRLSELALQDHDDSGFAALMLGWSMRMLTVGTVRKKQPTQRTIGRYYSAVDQALMTVAGDPLVLLAGDSQTCADLHKSLISASNRPEDLSAGLASLHTYLADEFGAEPV